jgi:hypothetical protein
MARALVRDREVTPQNPFYLPVLLISPCLFSNEGAKKQPQFIIRPAIQGFSRHILFLVRYSSSSLSVLTFCCGGNAHHFKIKTL